MGGVTLISAICRKIAEPGVRAMRISTQVSQRAEKRKAAAVSVTRIPQSCSESKLAMHSAVRWFDTRPLRPARPGHANHIDDSAERHYTEECQPT
jgi:hypothetical protein